jgi:hypothetical protein
MWFVTMTAPDEITTRSDLSNEALLSAVEDTATDHAMIDADLALVTGEESLLRPGRPFLEVDSLVPGRSPELVRAPAALVYLGPDLALRDLAERPGGIAAVEAHLATGLRWWWPVLIDGVVHLRDAGRREVKRHPALAYAVFTEDDFEDDLADRVPPL